jgi:hypothetical protein
VETTRGVERAPVVAEESTEAAVVVAVSVAITIAADETTA